MLNREQILEIARKDPRYVQGIQAIEQRIGDMPITGEGLDELVKMLELALNHPDKYPQIRAAAIKDGMVDEQDLPAKADPVLLVSLLVALYGLQDLQKHKTQRFAQGGLARAAKQLQAQGRNGDTMLAHINPAEAAMLRRAGGSGRINPATGLPEYGFLSDLVKIALPLAIDFFAPGVGTAIGSAVGASGAWAPIVGSALIGGATSAATGGNFLQGAAFGGLGAGLGGQLGGWASDATGWGLGDSAKNMLGSGIVGGVTGAANGQGFLQGAAQGAMGAYIGDKVNGLAGEGAFGTGVNTAGKTFGNALASGASPQEALTQSAFAGLMSGLGGTKVRKPSEEVVNTMKASPTDDIFNTGTQSSNKLFGVDQKPTAPWQTPSASSNQGLASGLGGAATNDAGEIIGMGRAVPDVATAAKPVKPEGMFTPNKIMGLAGIASGLSSMIAPPAAKVAVSSLSPQQQDYFNRPGVKWDWQKMQNDANAAGMGLSQYMAQNLPKISAYAQPGFAKGGALNQVAAFARGAGSGRDDTIDAKLSDGEYVFDAETTALLGDGSSEEGARRLDSMRSAIRSHKGKALARGKISPDAKSPLEYLKGVK